MTMDIRLIKEMREVTLREIEANRLAERAGRRLRRESRFGGSRLAAFAREVRLDFARLTGAVRVSGGISNRKGRR